MAAITRLGLSGIPRGLYGSFAGKEEAPDTGPHNPGEITRLGLSGIPRGLYGDFSGKEEAAPEIEPEIEPPPPAGGAEGTRRAKFTGRGFFVDDPDPTPEAPAPQKRPEEIRAEQPITGLLPRDQSSAQARLDAARDRARKAEAAARRRADDERLLAYLAEESARVAAALVKAIDNDDAEILLLDHAIRMDAVSMALQRILK